MAFRDAAPLASFAYHRVLQKAEKKGWSAEQIVAEILNEVNRFLQGQFEQKRIVPSQVNRSSAGQLEQKRPIVSSGRETKIQVPTSPYQAEILSGFNSEATKLGLSSEEASTLIQANRDAEQNNKLNKGQLRKIDQIAAHMRGENQQRFWDAVRIRLPYLAGAWEEIPEIW